MEKGLQEYVLEESRAEERVYDQYHKNDYYVGEPYRGGVLNAKVAIMYMFGMYRPTSNIQYGKMWGFTQPERAWRMYQSKIPVNVPSQAKLRNPNGIYTVRSQREENVIYSVKLSTNYCSCPNKAVIGKKRACKHICYIAYRFYIRLGSRLPKGLFISQGMDMNLSRSLYGMCESSGRPLENSYVFRIIKSRQLSSIFGKDTTLYTGVEITRKIFAGDVSHGVIVMSNFFGTNLNQRAVTITINARAMCRCVKWSYNRVVWLIPIVETRPPGWNNRTLQVNVNQQVRQEYLYQKVTFSYQRVSCTCMLHRQEEVFCDHIRAAYYLSFIDVVIKKSYNKRIFWKNLVDRWILSYVNKNVKHTEERIVRSISKERFSQLNLNIKNQGANKAEFRGNYYAGEIIPQYKIKKSHTFHMQSSVFKVSYIPTLEERDEDTREQEVSMEGVIQNVL